MKTSHLKQHGVTLVELMLAITIGLIVMLGVGTIYSNSKQTFYTQEEFSRLQENGRFALEYIARFVRGAGYAGCASGLNNVTNDLNNSSSLEWNFSTGIEGYEASGTGPNQSVTLSANPTATASGTEANWKTTGNVSIPSSMVGSSDSVIPDSDVIVARSADGNGVEIANTNNSAQLFLNVTSVEPGGCPDGTDKISGICDTDVLLVSDCQKSIAFQATNIQQVGSSGNYTLNVAHSAGSNPGNSTTSWGGAQPDLNRTFEPGAEVMKVSTKVFYVGEGVNGPALFMKQADGSGQELVEGVETLQVLYGEDTDATPDNVPNRYVTADKVADFTNVVSVKISLLLASVKELAHRKTNTTTYVLTGHSATTGVTVDPPDDKRMRRVMSLEIKLRNRGFSI